MTGNGDQGRSILTFGIGYRSMTSRWRGGHAASCRRSPTVRNVDGSATPEAIVTGARAVSEAIDSVGATEAQLHVDYVLRHVCCHGRLSASEAIAQNFRLEATRHHRR